MPPIDDLGHPGRRVLDKPYSSPNREVTSAPAGSLACGYKGEIVAYHASGVTTWWRATGEVGETTWMLVEGEGASSGGGDASAANQTTQTALLTTMDASLTEIETTQDAELALLTTIDASLNDIEAAVEGAGINTKDAGPAWTGSFGVSSAAVLSADATGSVAVTAAPTGGQKLVITDVLISSEVEQWVELEEETSGTILFRVYLSANGSFQFTPRGKLKLATADKKLMVDAEIAGNVAVTAFYYSEA